MSLKHPNDEELASMNENIRITRRRSSMLVDFDPQKPSPFDDMPDEIIIEIMRYLDRNSLKNAFLVNNRFNELGTLSLLVMNNFPLTVGLFKGAKNREIMKLNRRYRAITFKDIVVTKWFKYMKQTLAHIGKDASRIYFEDCQFDNFYEIILNFPKVEKLTVTSAETFIDVPALKTLEPHKFQQLKYLKVENITSILESFASIQLESLQIVQLRGNDWQNLMELLKNQTKLRELFLVDVYNMPLDLQLSPLKDQLKLNSLCILFLNNIDVAKFVEFLLLFVGKIQCLTIVQAERTLGMQLIFEAVMQNFKNISGLAVAFEFFPKEEEFYRKLKPNHNLMILVLNCNPLNNPVGFRGVVSAYPSVQALSLSISHIDDNMTAEDFEFMYENFKNLRKFFLVVVNSIELDRGCFKNVTSLNINNYTLKIDWEFIAQRNPNLQSVNILKIANPRSFDFESLVSNVKNLSTLELNEGFVFTKAELKILQKYAKNLKSFIMLKENWSINESPEQALNLRGIEGITIKLQSFAMENVSYYGNTFFYTSS